MAQLGVGEEAEEEAACSSEALEGGEIEVLHYVEEDVVGQFVEETVI